MISWISQNWGTIAICIFLAAVVIAILSVLIKDKKSGRSSCGGNCSHCSACGNCGNPATPLHSQSGHHPEDNLSHNHILSENQLQNPHPKP